MTLDHGLAAMGEPPTQANRPATTGRVLRVGAGPGDPHLLTPEALRAIRHATVVLVDELVSVAVLRLVRRDTRIVHVGKRGGGAGTPQSFIERRMVVEAHGGECLRRTADAPCQCARSDLRHGPCVTQRGAARAGATHEFARPIRGSARCTAERGTNAWRRPATFASPPPRCA